MRVYPKEVNENRHSKDGLLADLIRLNRFDEYFRIYIFFIDEIIENDNEELVEFYKFLQGLIVKYGLDFKLNNEEYIIDRIYGNGVNTDVETGVSTEKVAYDYFEKFLKQSLLNPIPVKDGL